MRTVTYKSVANNISLLANSGSSASIGDPSNQESAAINILINRRAPEYWNRYWWPDLMLVEKRYFRPAWSSVTTYAAGTEIYFYQEQRHYQALKAGVVTTPPTTSAGVVNTDSWYESLPSYPGTDYSTSLSYVAGDVVNYEADGNSYCCHTAASAGVLPTDTSKWGLLTPFIRSIDLTLSGSTEIGDIKDVWTRDPRVAGNAEPVSGWTVQNDYVVIPGTQPYHWIEFRTRAPEWTGSDYSSTTSYSAGDKVYHADTGSYYEANQSATGQEPSSGSAYWDTIEFPYDLSRVVVQSVYADMLRRSNQNDRYISEISEAERMLSLDIDRFSRQQQQGASMRVHSR